ncbi:MAG: ABC transporter ATP-binding protein [Actinomycetota bacterium]
MALDDVSITVADGETLAVVGPSGSGKSTLLRAVAGLEPLAAGSVTAGGVELDALATHRRDLGLMFQDHALFPQLDVAGNIAFGLRMQGWSSARQRERVGELLTLMGLSGFEGRAVHELSGGEAQRVALARALAPEPRLLMLDEPFGSLDRILREQLTGELRRLLDELGQTALHVTHDQEEAFALADRVAVLRAGRLEQVGRPEELWRSPSTPFVAAFVGHPNRWTVTADADGLLRWGGAALGVHPVLRSAESLVVAPVAAVSVDDDGPIGGRVVRATFVEGRHRVEVDVDGAPAGEATVVVEHHRRLDRGAAVRLAVVIDQLVAVASAG